MTVIVNYDVDPSRPIDGLPLNGDPPLEAPFQGLSKTHE